METSKNLPKLAKMGALDTRAFIQASGDYYLTPLAQIGDVPELMEELLKPVWEMSYLIYYTRGLGGCSLPDYFMKPHQRAISVEPTGKLTTLWGTLKTE